MKTCRALLLLFAAATLPAQERAEAPVALEVSISPAQLAFVTKPEVTLIDSQQELDAFQARARVIPEGNPLRVYRKELEPMKVDFDAVRLVAVCWGPHPFVRQARFRLESSRMIGMTVHLVLRTSMFVGKPGARRPNHPETVYPAQMIAVPRTDRVLVHLTGARKQQDGFEPVRSERLMVSVAPDSMVLRDQVELLPVQQHYVSEGTPHVLVEPAEQEGRQIVDIAWCAFDSESNSLQVETLEMRGDALHVGVVANRFLPMIYSGPGAMRPRMRLVAPDSARVVVHIRRTGEAITAKDKLRDFEPFTKGKIEVSVEHRSVPKSPWRVGGFLGGR